MSSLYFDNKPDALSDGSFASRFASTLDQLKRHRRYLFDEIEGELRHAHLQIDSVQDRMDSIRRDPSRGSSFNSLGEFQQCISHRADLMIVQFRQVDEIARQLEYIIDPPPPEPPKEKESNEQQPASRSVRKAAKPRKEVGKRAAKRPKQADRK